MFSNRNPFKLEQILKGFFWQHIQKCKFKKKPEMNSVYYMTFLFTCAVGQTKYLESIHENEQRDQSYYQDIQNLTEKS